MTLKLLATILLLAGASQALQDNPDEVTSLPGLHFKLNFRHFSGYLSSVNQSSLHYWFFESQRDPANDPVVLWLNGGPGCSSLLGALTENGPIALNRDGSLSQNKFAWNQRANVLFLESPAGVGFSFNQARSYATGDNATALLNYEALKSFYQKYPQYVQNEFYITGESYGGVYIPTLAVNVQNGKYPVNFRGIAIGNGYLDQNLLANSLLYFTYDHGLYGKELFNDMLEKCCDNVAPIEKCDIVNNHKYPCMEAVSNVQAVINESPLNWYNIYADCDHSAGQNSAIQLTPDQADKRFMRTHLLKRVKDSGFQLQDDPPCVNLEFVADYLNMKSVRTALHISPQSDPWSPCSAAVNGNYTNEYESLTDVMKNLLNNGLKALIYNGDVDTVCNFLGDQWFAEGLGRKAESDYAPWLLNKQVAGYYKLYDGLGYTTIRGSGHTVPTDKPEVALAMFNKFLDYTGSS